MFHADESQNGGKIDLAVGDTLELRLPENPTTGFRWSLRSDGGPSCTMIQDDFTPPGTRPGQGGVHTWRFRALRAGQGVIDLVCQRHWEQTAGREFKLQVEVKP